MSVMQENGQGMILENGQIGGRDHAGDFDMQGREHFRCLADNGLLLGGVLVGGQVKRELIPAGFQAAEILG